ncbi:MAG: beta strand repeat-containing protein [Myxococcaceae bacterium]
MRNQNLATRLSAPVLAALASITLLAGGAASAQPVNDTCAGAIVIPNSGPSPQVGAVTADVTLATTAGDPTATCGIRSHGVWYQYTPTITGPHAVQTCSTAGTGTTVLDTVIAVYTSTGGCAGPFVQVTSSCNDDSCAAQSRVTITLTAGTTYYILAWVYGTVAPPAGETAIGVAVEPPPPPPANDACVGAEVIPSSGTFPQSSTLTSNILSATTTGDPTASCMAATSLSRSIWYTYTPTVTGPFYVQTCAAAGINDTTLPDTVLSIYTSTSGCTGPFTEVTNGCNDNSCASQSRATATLTAGTTYYVVVWKHFTTAPVAPNTAVQVTVDVPPPPPANDLCSRAIPLALDVPAFGTVESAANDYQLDAGSACFTGIGQTASTGPGLDVAYSFTAPKAGDYSFRVRNSSYNSVLYVGTSCQTGGAPTTVTDCSGASNRTSSGVNGEEVSCLPMSAGATVYAFADQHLLASFSEFQLEVNECIAESDRATGGSNDTPATADAPVCGLTGSIVRPDGGAGDIDFYRLGTPPADSRVFALVDGVAASINDFDLRVTTATTTLEYDDSNNDTPFGSVSANIAGTPLTAVESFLRVNYFSANPAEPYRLYTVVQPPITTATPEAEPNDTTAGANSSPANYFTGVLSGTAPSADIDLYSFTAAAGDLVVMGLDGDPTRTNSPVGAKVALLDSAGALILEVNDTSTTSSVSAGTTLTSIVPYAPAEALTYRVVTAGTYYARVAIGTTATGSTGAGDYLLSITKNCLPSAPWVAASSPTYGPLAGGQSITLSGLGFVAGATVTIGGNAATGVIVVDDRTITLTTPAGTLGPADVVVTNPDSNTGTLSSGYTYRAAPVVSSVAPVFGPAGGGTAVTITGTGFLSGASVTIGGTAATGLTIVSDTSITATSPAGTVGPADVKVTNADGQFGTLVGGFEYMPSPTVTAISPAAGREGGGTNVTLTGTRFAAGAIVTIGGVAATNVVVVNATTITATTPAGAVSAADVVVTNLDLQSGTLTGGFTYLAAPTVVSIAPTSGFAVGGTSVTITGTNFAAPAIVNIGGTGAATVVVVNSTTITATTPPGTPGAADVAVSIDTVIATLAGAFTYVPAPTVTSLNPAFGYASGGTAVTITGTGFLPAATVTFGGTAATTVTVVSATSITATTPAGTAGAADVVVTNSDTQTGTLTGGFTYMPAPTVASIAPASGPSSGGTNVTITGANFLAGATVSIGGNAATNIVVVGPTSITATTSAGSASAANVVVTNADGQSGILAGGFTYVLAPTVTAVSPAFGPASGGNRVTLTGTGFGSGATVTIGGAAATAITVAGATSLSATAPPGTVGAVDVVVTNSDTQSGSLVGAYTYVAAPTVTAITPSSGRASGGTSVTLTGTGFTNGASIRIGGAAATGVVVASATSATATTAAGNPGAQDVVFTNADGQSGTLTGGFTYVPAPTVESLAPSSGPEAGGTSVTITGTGFASGAGVTIGGLAATSVAFVSATSLTATTPAGAGVALVVVTNADGQAGSLGNAFTYIAPVQDGGAGGGGGGAGGGGGGAGGGGGGAGGGGGGAGGGGGGAGGGAGGGGGSEADAGTGPTPAPGCGCGHLDLGSLGFALMALTGLIARRRARK